MICYRDMTFCNEVDCEDFSTCGRGLTEEVREQAKQRGLPISQFTHTPYCFASVGGVDVLVKCDHSHCEERKEDDSCDVYESPKYCPDYKEE